MGYLYILKRFYGSFLTICEENIVPMGNRMGAAWIKRYQIRDLYTIKIVYVCLPQLVPAGALILLIRDETREIMGLCRE